MSEAAPALRLYSTCPPSVPAGADPYLARVTEIAQWSDRAGYHGILIYSDNRLVDPWLVAQAVVTSTTRLTPLVALQPLYMHPYATAKMISTIAHLYGRRVDLNMVAGGFRNDLRALGDETEHDDRYARLVEYALIVQALLREESPVTFAGRYYSVSRLTMTLRLPYELQPEFLVSGSSPAGRTAAAALGATAVRYPKPANEEKLEEVVAREGIRVGVISRSEADDAWEIAHTRFPGDPRGRLMHKLAMQVSDSHWHRQLARGDWADSGGATYWLWPFQNYSTFCPYLVGSYESVGAELGDYVRRGVRSFILDVPASEAEHQHIACAFEAARAVAA
jgi:alkanesulfonate monooxygenase